MYYKAKLLTIFDIVKSLFQENGDEAIEWII